MPKLTEDALTAALTTLPGWRLDNGKLVHDYTFTGFAAAMDFVNQVAALAESANHHPDIDIRFDKVRLALISHDSAGITKRDLRLASALNETFAPSQA